MIPEAPALESTADIGVRDRYGLFIGGDWVAPETGAYVISENPATDEPLALVARATAADVDRALRAARRAYEKSWRKIKPAERAKYLYRIARAIAERTRVLALMETIDGGAPIRSVRDVVGHAATTAFYYAGWADKLAWAIGGHERARAIGVVGALVSARSPIACAIDILAPALAAGNTLVLKASTCAPLGVLALAQICAEVDLPPGVVNVITGESDVSATLVEHPDCDLLACEGSIGVASAIRRVTATRRIPLRASVDGPACIIVFDDAPLDAAIEAIVAATYRAGTKTSRSGTLVLVHESLETDVVARLTARLRTLRHGDPLDRNTDVGAFASRTHRDRLAARVDRAVAGGATLLAAPWTPPDVGAFRAAAILIDLPPSFDLVSSDASGPFATLATFRTPAEALERAAAFAPASASVWTSSGAQALYTAQRFAAGVVWCNTFDRFDAGRVGGPAGLRAYLDL